MIKLTKSLAISSTDFFDYITKSILADIEKSTNKKLSKESLNGYAYDKILKNKLGKSGNVHINIDEYIYPKSYKATFLYGAGEHYISYEVESTDNSSCKVTYIENFNANSWFGNVNSKFVNFLYKNKAIRKIKLMLQSIENTILATKKDVNE